MAPVPIEDRVKERLPFLSNVMLIGDKRKYLSMLMTLKVINHSVTYLHICGYRIIQLKLIITKSLTIQKQP